MLLLQVVKLANQRAQHIHVTVESQLLDFQFAELSCIMSMWAEESINASRALPVSDAAILPRGGPNQLDQGERLIL